MVTLDSVEAQLKRIGFNHHAWGKTEAKELCNILVSSEEIYECVNGVYEGGFALLVATNIRLLLVDKKPLNYLTVEDLRFDMINEIDYSHRLLGAHISISTGSKNLRFTSYNQPRLRSLINRVQQSMAEAKQRQSEHQQDQNQHLGQINQQLQAYLLAQYQQQQHQQMKEEQASTAAPVVLMPPMGDAANPQLTDLYNEGFQEIFGKRQVAAADPAVAPVAPVAQQPVVVAVAAPAAVSATPEEVNALRVAYSKLPMALRNRKFGRPSFHAHSQQPVEPATY